MKALNLFFILIFSVCFSQENNVLERLSALNNNGKIWYNIDGYSITSEKFNNSFDEKGLKKVFRKHQITDSDVKTKDDQIKFNNLFISKQQKIDDNNFQTNNYYFVENPDKTVSVIWFIKNGKTDKETEEKMVNLIIENKIPEENFVPMKITSINFAGRKIELGNSCYWTFLNTVQCPYLGEMNWSVHRNLESAKEAIENQLNITKSKKGGKVASEEIVDVEFEGVQTKAKKVIYDFTGIASALAGMSGGKNLTVYYVAENVRNKNVSCVMSFWNNDQINPETKLPPLLEKIMKLK
ncbi:MULTISPECIES: hypothetical protein [Chryseobacterium]|uniref:hypothetical protein n=1 Tax=Chryseobacterium TaxID=59732 RepID=UPI000FA6132C|nr:MULTISPECIES: hypothetical protein [Chryseobacterium]MBM7420338.1 hypothetical protein [Chryseobacterium sp. JUb44]MDH6210285.1 hypothetical protein [Chryseobacterium sp. BIGb0186]WSO08995.1 hypothetical protein VUJ64_14295 [Chryseobacterium scophthalmum]